MSEYAPVRTITKIEANPALTSRKDEYRRMRVAAYCRVSTDEEDQLNSLDTQVKYYTGKIAENPNWTMVGIYADEGITGTRTDKREKFLKLMRDCEKGKIDPILTKSTTRFARNTVDSLTWIRKLRAMGIGVYFEEQNLDSLKAENETLLGFFSVMAQSESESISANVKWGIQKRMKNGTYSLRFKMLGLRKGDDGNPYIVADEAEVVRALFRMILDGASLGQLKDFLESNNIKTPEGKDVWSISVIRYMLSNEKYVGDVLYQKTFRTDCISKKAKVNRGEVTRYRSPTITLRLLTVIPSTWYKPSLREETISERNLILLLPSRESTARNMPLQSCLCAGLAVVLFRRTSKSAKGKTTYYWRCVSRIEHGKTYCKDSAGIEEQMLHEAICRCLSKMMVNSGEVFSLIQSNLSYAVSGNNAALDVFSIEKQMNELKVDIQQMTELAARTEGDPERYEVELKKMFDQLVILRGKLDLAKSQASQSDTVNAEVARIMDILKQTDMNFTEFDDVTVRRLVECIKSAEIKNHRNSQRRLSSRRRITKNRSSIK